jgi:hypothetical protein
VVDVDAVVDVTGNVALDVFVPAEFVRPGAVTRVWCIPSGEFGSSDEQLVDWRGHPSGGGFMSGTLPLTIGEWSVYAQLVLPVDAAEPRIGVAFGRVHIDAGATRALAVELVRAATVSFPAGHSHLPDMVNGLALEGLPHWRYFSPFPVAPMGERIHVTGLLPNTNHVATDGNGRNPILVRTGDPGTTVEIE